jgi:hypothetical protein
MSLERGLGAKCLESVLLMTPSKKTKPRKNQSNPIQIEDDSEQSSKNHIETLHLPTTQLYLSIVYDSFLRIL